MPDQNPPEPRPSTDPPESSSPAAPKGFQPVVENDPHAAPTRAAGQPDEESGEGGRHGRPNDDEDDGHS